MGLEKIKQAIEARTADYRELYSSYDELVKRTEVFINVEPGGDIGSLKRIREYSLVLRQALLHRATKLFSGSLEALASDNVYTMVLSIRGHIETVAALGYLHHRLNSLSEGNLSAEIVDQDIFQMLLGSRDAGILKLAQNYEYDFHAKHIMDMIDYADRTVNKHLFKGKIKNENLDKIENILRNSYEFLCEFSHPNFHSHTASYRLNKEEKRFYFNGQQKMADNFCHLIDHLLISHPLFVYLFDNMDNLIPS